METKTRAFQLAKSTHEKLTRMSDKLDKPMYQIVCELIESAKVKDLDIAHHPKKTRCYELPPYALAKLRKLAADNRVSTATVIEELCLSPRASD
jgi:hypothetical protein